MAFDDVEVVGFQRTGLLEDALGHRQLAHVVE
jgi:hypothetical protein